MAQTTGRTDAKRFLEIMNGWLCDPEFQRLGRWEKTRHWLDYQKLGEGNYRDFLLWILSPREGHGLGDFFIKRLLLSLWHGEAHRERLRTWSKAKWWVDPAQLEQVSFSGALLDKEVMTSDYASCPRIDIVLVDPTHKLLVMIERKDGHVVSATQLPEYEKWATRKYGEYKQLWVLSDSCGKKQKNSNENWLQIHDGWLIEALKEVTKARQVPPIIERQFEEFLCLLEGRGLCDIDEYYGALDADFSSFATKNASQVGELRALEHNGELFTAIDQRKAISVLPGLSRTWENGRRAEAQAAVELATRHHAVLQRLVSENLLDTIRRDLESKHAGTITSLWRDRKGADRLAISLARFEKREKWPCFVQVTWAAEDAAAASEAESGSCRVVTWLQIRSEFEHAAHTERWNEVVARYRDSSAKDGGWLKLSERRVEALISVDQLADEMALLRQIDRALSSSATVRQAA